MKASRLAEEWLIFGVKRCVYQRLPIPSLNLKHHTPPEETFLDRSRQRILAEATPGNNKFSVTATTEVDSIYIHPADVTADKKVWYKDVPLCDNQNRVFLNHDVVEFEKRRGKKSIICLKFVDELDKTEIMAVILRKLSRSNSIPTMARLELIRIAKDELGFDYDLISQLVVSKFKGRKAINEVISEYRTAKIYEELGTFKAAIGGKRLMDVPEAMSKIKFLNGRTEIREAMENSRKAREHFVNMAIGTTILREQRFQALVPKMLKHEDTKRILFEENYTKAKSTLLKLYPEHNKDVYPLIDMISVNQKLHPENIRITAAQIESNPDNNEFLTNLLEVISKITSASPSAHAKVNAITSQLRLHRAKR